MRTAYVLALTLVATALVTSHTSYAQDPDSGKPLVLNLACEGGGLTGTQNGYNARLFVHINGTGGEIQIPRQIVGGFRQADTWFPLRDVVVGADEISARYRAGALSSPRVEIDRVHGELRLVSGAGTFNGVCSPYDPDTVQKAF
ncbi:exported hypothetical protein [Luteimonas sp. 9C]|uniref:hypothetical protein n=1 Tax=Luteimonas sp. 9C TaxID=2653148 RepID=UPI0012F00585|nr:hypothetical protein [Luteimonas sp. 9C]VXB24951.1 exported hypothetical protein [Luteimonas sp. 9C]